MTTVTALVRREMLELHDRENGAVGDCFRAAIATVLGMETADVPHFVKQDIEANGWEDDSGQWWDLTLDWLWDNGWWVREYDERPDVPHLETGPGPRGHQHTVAVDADGTVLDPHPSQDGLLSVEWRLAIIPAEEATHE